MRSGHFHFNPMRGYLISPTFNIMPVKYISIVFFALSFLFLAACSENRISERCQTSDAAGQNAAQKYAKLQAKIQSILDEAVAKNWQNAAQCCIYIDGVLAVDAWAGYYDKDKKRKIDGNSLFPIYSTGKPILATAVNRAVEMGKLDYDMKISSVWREFGRNGKENITLRHVITHHSGLQSSPNAGTTHEQYCDWRYMVKQCGNFKPLCEAGSKMRYLSQTYAWLMGEPLARAMNMPIRDALVKLALEPAGIEKDFFFGIDDTVPTSRCVTVYNGKNPNSQFEGMNMEIFRRACVPSSNAMANARALAKFYVRLAGMDGNAPLLKPETFKAATTPYLARGETNPSAKKSGWNPVWGLGYTLGGDAPDYNNIVGQGGFGGSYACADTKRRIAYGYTCSTENNATPHSDLSPKIAEALYDFID